MQEPQVACQCRAKWLPSFTEIYTLFFQIIPTDLLISHDNIHFSISKIQELSDCSQFIKFLCCSKFFPSAAITNMPSFKG